VITFLNLVLQASDFGKHADNAEVRTSSQKPIEHTHVGKSVIIESEKKIQER
jgi:hypothetical protein